jgi:hypothetical protein
LVVLSIHSRGLEKMNLLAEKSKVSKNDGGGRGDRRRSMWKRGVKYEGHR